MTNASRTASNRKPQDRLKRGTGKFYWDGLHEFINQGGDVNSLNADGLTVLEEVCCDSSVSYGAVCHIIDEGADLSLISPHNQVHHIIMPLTSDIFSRPETQDEILRYLVTSGLDLNAVDENGKTALQIFLEQGDLARAQRLINLRVIPTDEELQKLNALRAEEAKASVKTNYYSFQDIKSVKLFKAVHNKEAFEEVKSTWDKPDMYDGKTFKDVLESKDKDGNTPLLFALKYNDVEYALFLIQNGADVFAKNNKGQTAMILAYRLGRQDVMDLLFAKGAGLTDPLEQDVDNSKNQLKRPKEKPVETLCYVQLQGEPPHSARNPNEFKAWREKEREYTALFNKIKGLIETNPQKAYEEISKLPEDFNVNVLGYTGDGYKKKTLAHLLVEKAVALEIELKNLETKIQEAGSDASAQDKALYGAKEQELTSLHNALKSLKGANFEIRDTDKKCTPIEYALQANAPKTVRELDRLGASVVRLNNGRTVALDTITDGVDRYPVNNLEYLKTIGVSRGELDPETVIVVDLSTREKKRVPKKDVSLQNMASDHMLHVSGDGYDGYVYLTDSKGKHDTNEYDIFTWIGEVFAGQGARPGDRIKVHEANGVLSSGINRKALFEDLLNCGEKGDLEGFFLLVAATDVINTHGANAERWMVEERLNALYGDFYPSKYEDKKCNGYMEHPETRVFQEITDENGWTLLGHFEAIRRELIAKGQSTDKIDRMMQLMYARNGALTQLSVHDIHSTQSTVLSEMAEQGDGSVGSMLSTGKINTQPGRIERLNTAISEGNTYQVRKMLEEKPPLDLNAVSSDHTLPLKKAFETYRSYLMSYQKKKIDVSELWSKTSDLTEIIHLLVANGAYVNAVPNWTEYVSPSRYGIKNQDTYFLTENRLKLLRLMRSTPARPVNDKSVSDQPIVAQKGGICHELDDAPYSEILPILITKNDAYSIGMYIDKDIKVAECKEGGNENILLSPELKRNAMHVLANEGDLKHIQKLYEEYPESFKLLVNQKDVNGDTPFDLAVKSGYNHVAQYLLDEIDENKEDLLLRAVKAKASPEIIYLMVEKGADVSINDPSIFEYLINNPEKRHDVVKGIFERIGPEKATKVLQEYFKRVKPDLGTSHVFSVMWQHAPQESKNALFESVAKDKEALKNLLYALKDDLTTPIGKQQKTPLEIAMSLGDNQFMAKLIVEGARLDAQTDELGKHPKLMHALLTEVSSKPYPEETVKYVLSICKGVDISEKISSLMKRGHREEFFKELLLQKDKDGKIPVQNLTPKQKIDIFKTAVNREPYSSYSNKFLIEWMRLSTENLDEKTKNSMMNEYIDCLKKRWGEGVVILFFTEAPQSVKNDLVDNAVKNKDKELVKRMLSALTEKEINNPLGKQQKTPLEIAILLGDKELVKELIEKGAKTSAQLQASDGNLHVLNDAQTNVPEDKRALRVATRSRG